MIFFFPSSEVSGKRQCLMHPGTIYEKIDVGVVFPLVCLGYSVNGAMLSQSSQPFKSKLQMEYFHFCGCNTCIKEKEHLCQPTPNGFSDFLL